MNMKSIRAQFENTLDFCKVDYANDGVEANLDQWKENKTPLIDLLRKHPQWNEDALAIVVREKEERACDGRLVTSYCRSIYHAMGVMEDKIHAAEWIGSIEWGMLATKIIGDELAADLNLHFKTYTTASVGQKTSRYLRKLFLGMGIPKDEENFWAIYAKLADELNPYEIERPLIISVNPSDYLTMSYGSNWSSCHIINPDISLGGDTYHGMYKAGCLSYLGDETSIITYTVDKVPDDLRDLPKTPRMTRQMFHVNLDENLILQSRMYPYTNDIGLIDVRRTIVQGVLAQCFGIANLWTRKSDSHAGFCAGNGSLNYRDYEYGERNHISVSYPSNSDPDLDNDAQIGAPALCLKCGDEIDDHEEIHCNSCANDHVCTVCGRDGDGDLMHMINGEWCCENCCFWCEYHEEWEVGSPEDDTRYVEDYGYVCDYAVCESGYFFWDDADEEWLVCDQYPDRVHTANGLDFHSPVAAFDAGYAPCEECGDWERIDNMFETIDGEGYLCEWCSTHTDMVTCEDCGEKYNSRLTDHCPNCGVVREVA